MNGALSCLLVAAITAHRTVNAVLGVGLASIFVLLTVLVWTRWGQARPIAKCVVLSLLAHLLLLIYGYSTHILAGPPGKWNGSAVTVRLRDASDPFEAAPVKSNSPQPWQQPGESNAPLLLSDNDKKREDKKAAETESPPESAAPPELLAATDKPPQPPAEPEPPAEAKAEPPKEQPQLADLLPDQSPAASDAAQAPAATVASPSTNVSQIPAAPILADEDAISPPGDDRQFVAASRRPAARRLGDGLEVPEPLSARVASNRLQAAQPFGATAQTENAVAAALNWLAANQNPDGRWDADQHGAGRETRNVLGHDRRDPRTGSMTGTQADTGITGLALLAFLGSGETHLSGEHRHAVQLGLEYLLSVQASDGNLAGNAEVFAAMYCHGMATLALGEAYALSGDDRLLPGLKRAIGFTIAAQSSAGGWRYRPNEPTDPGDLSQFGWQLMALKSADLGGLPTPIGTRVKMVRFLQSCSIGNRRGLAGYRPGDRASRTMTAEGLVCRYFLDSENTPAALDEGAAYVIEERPSQKAPNYYYWYYGTLAMFQRQGSDWQRWNAALQAELLARQQWNSSLAGSYDPDDLWGGYGGRVYSTALATLCLEVYYRYLPIHGRDLDDSRLTDRPWQPAVSR
ncbi:MAG TPA: prenyltransferase/squalene oxidase repeat-containing protein [Pirellulaceae bacterium]|jgi:hypothetical protein